MSSAIEWTQKTPNPLLVLRAGKVGWFCVKYSPECARCDAGALNMDPRAKSSRRRGVQLPYNIKSARDLEPLLDLDCVLRFQRSRKRFLIFPCDMTDIALSVLCCRSCGEAWEDEEADADHCRACESDDLKRFWPTVWVQGLLDLYDELARMGHVVQSLTKRTTRFLRELRYWSHRNGRTMHRNVWLGFSAGNQRVFDERWPTVRQWREFAEGPLWVSYEPGLGAVDMLDALGGWECLACGYSPRESGIVERPTFCPLCAGDNGWEVRVASIPRLDWGVAGGESGREARGYCVDHAFSFLRQFEAVGVPAFQKQLGKNPYMLNPPDFRSWPVPLDVYVDPEGRTRWIPRLKHPKGGDVAEWPASLRVRQLPYRPGEGG